MPTYIPHQRYKIMLDFMTRMTDNYTIGKRNEAMKMNNYRVTVEYKGGYVDTTDFMVLKFALKWMHYIHAHFHNIVCVKLECL